MRNLFLSVVVLLLVAVSCARNPATGRREFVLMSEGQEIALGLEADQQARREYGEVESPALQAYLRDLGRKLVSVSHRPNLEWDFTVVDSPVVNAFALPGGHVYFTRGILAQFSNEAELASVMGHEIAHITARHTVRQATRSQLAQIGLQVGSALSNTFGQFGSIAETGLGVLFLRFSRDSEREADRLGVEYAVRGSYDAREVSRFFEVLGRMSEAGDRATIPGWLSTHPDPGQRAETTRGLAEEWIGRLETPPERLAVNRDGYLRQLDGLVYGDNPREGFVEDGVFYHPDMRFQLEFPRDWRVENTKSAVNVADAAGRAQIQLTVAEVPAGTGVDEHVRALAQQGFRPESGDFVTINGHRAYLGIYLLPIQGGTIPSLAALIENDGRILEFVGVANELQTMLPVFERSFRSFRTLTNRRLLDVQPDVMRIHSAREGETLTEIARRLGNPRVDADHLAVLNRLSIDFELTAGRLVKTVVRGR